MVNFTANPVTPSFSTEEKCLRPITGYQILCKVGPHPLSLAAELFPQALSDLLLCELFRIPKTVTTSTLSFGWQTLPVSHSVPNPGNPLRLISSRFPQFEDFYGDGTQKLAWYVDTLVCGHQVLVFDLEFAGQRRHRCAECAASQKKPVQSVRAFAAKAGAR